MIYPDLLNWKEMDMNPYLSGGLCRMTKQGACRWSTHGSQSGNLWSSTCALHTVQLHCAAHLQKANSHRAPLERIYGSVHFIQCATVLSLWEHFILLVWSASYILLTFEPAHCLLESRTACCSIVGSCLPAAALALVLNCSSSLSHWPGNTHSTCSTYQKCFVTRPAGASLLWLNHWSRLQPVGHTFNHLSCCSLFKPVNNIECKNAIHRKTIIGGTLKFHKNSWQVLLNA